MLNDNDTDAVIDNLYGIFKPDPAVVEARNKKVASLILQMGDKYLLAKPVQKVPVSRVLGR